MGLPGKPDRISGADVQRYYREGHIREIAEYCESDVVNAYRVWLQHELFRGRRSLWDFAASEAALIEFINARGQHEAAPCLSPVARKLLNHSLLRALLTALEKTE
jgi:3'-5' exonuclease